jgi:hypothetical protein
VSAQTALRAAAGEIGYYAPDDPEPGSKYGRWAAQQLNQAWLRGPSTSIWWCMLFASWAVYTTGGTIPGGISFNTDNTLAAARRAGATVSRANAQPGDLIIYDWDGNGVTDHVGILEVNHGSYIQTIEGNTSGSSGGSQSAGNGVWRRTRGWESVAGVVRPAYSGASVNTPGTAVTAKTTSTDKQYLLDQDGDRGAATNARWQQVMGTPIDGRIDRPSPAVKQFQTFLTTVVSTKDIENLRPAGASGSFVDGYLGAWTWKVFQYWFANAYPQHMKNICGFTIASNRDRFWAEWCDGVEGAWTDTALQWCLNQSWAGSGKLCAK